MIETRKVGIKKKARRSRRKAEEENSGKVRTHERISTMKKRLRSEEGKKNTKIEEKVVTGKRWGMKRISKRREAFNKRRRK